MDFDWENADEDTSTRDIVLYHTYGNMQFLIDKANSVFSIRNMPVKIYSATTDYSISLHDFLPCG